MRLWPLGWADLLTELRPTRCLNVNGVGGFEFADVVYIGAKNVRMLKEIRGLEIDFTKPHRMFRREC